MTHFMTTDHDGDTIQLHTYHDGFAGITVCEGGSYRVAYLARDAAVELRDKLTELLGDEPKPTTIGTVNVQITPTLDLSVLEEQIRTFSAGKGSW